LSGDEILFFGLRKASLVQIDKRAIMPGWW
jgi:hypothetical protein